jgi:hypothetical protein
MNQARRELAFAQPCLDDAVTANVGSIPITRSILRPTPTGQHLDLIWQWMVCHRSATSS